MKKPVVIFIVGPTGSGKTQAGLALGRFLPCEFISVDSMQVYRGMDIVTDKLAGALRKKYRYHLLDIISPTRDYNVALFCRAAARAIGAIVRRKKVPVVIGGTGLYVRSLVHGIFAQGSSAKVRLGFERIGRERGNAFLYERLRQVDPEAAGRISPNDTKRLIRALEVFEMAHQPISELQKKRRGLEARYDVRIFGLRREREDLCARIDQRVDFMVNTGLLDEVRRLLKKKLSKTAYQCIGIREMESVLKQERDLKEAVDLLKCHSRRFAKRQMTWFKREPGIQWLDVAAGADLEDVAGMIFKRIKMADGTLH